MTKLKVISSCPQHGGIHRIALYSLWEQTTDSSAASMATNSDFLQLKGSHDWVLSWTFWVAFLFRVRPSGRGKSYPDQELLPCATKVVNAVGKD